MRLFLPAPALLAGSVLCAAAHAQPGCGLRNQMRIINQVNAGTAQPIIIDTGWQMPPSGEPVESVRTAFDSSPNGTTSGTWSALSRFGFLEFFGQATGSNSPGFAVNCACDETFEGVPKAWFRDTILPVSDTLAPGAPVTIRATLVLTGTASSSDPGAVRTFRAMFFDDDLTLFNIAITNAPGSDDETFILPVGVPLTINGQLLCALRAQRLSTGQGVFTDTIEADLSASVLLEVLTPDVTIATCSGASYGLPCSADLGRQGGVAQPDGRLDNNDFIVFIDEFFDQSTVADRGSTGGVPGPDGAFDNNDFVVFVDQFFAGCP